MMAKNCHHEDHDRTRFRMMAYNIFQYAHGLVSDNLNKHMLLNDNPCYVKERLVHGPFPMINTTK